MMRFNSPFLFSQVEDGASCNLRIKNNTGSLLGIYYVQYTVFHGDEESIDGSDPIIIARGDSYIQETTHFKRIRECYFDKLSNHVEIDAIYTGNTTASKSSFYANITYITDDTTWTPINGATVS